MEGNNNYELPDQFDMQTAEAIHQQLQTMTDGDLIINGGEVKKIDTAALQLLISLKNTLQIQGHQLAWTEISNTIERSATALGLTQELNFPE